MPLSSLLFADGEVAALWSKNNQQREHLNISSKPKTREQGRGEKERETGLQKKIKKINVHRRGHNSEEEEKKEEKK